MRRNLVSAVVAVVLLGVVSIPVWGQSAGDEINALKKQLDEQHQQVRELYQKMEELEGVEAGGGLLEELQSMARINLYGTLEYSNFEETDSAFQGRDFELLVDIKASQRLRIFAGFQAVDQCSNCHKPGTGTAYLNTRRGHDGNVAITQGWLEYSANRYINPRAGVILVPFGRYNLEHYDTTQDLVSRPIMTLDVLPGIWAEAGAGFVGSAAFGEFELNYQAFAVNGLTDSHIRDTGLGMTPGLFNQDNNHNKALVGRLELNPIENISLGISGYLGEYDAEDDEKDFIEGYDIDLKLSYGPAELVGEFANFDLDEGVSEKGDIIVPTNFQGGYVEGRYHFWFDFLNRTFLGRGFDDPTFTLVARAEYAEIDDEYNLNPGDPDLDEPASDDEENREDRYTFGLNYRPIESFVFKVEYQINNTRNESLQWGDKNGFMASVSAAF